MEGASTVACPVCTLYLRPGITLENHLASHPKQKVIEALIKVTQVGPQEKINNDYNQQTTSGAPMFPPVNISANMNQVPTNHSFIYQQFMSTSGTQPILNVNPMNQQFVAIPTVFNPQMVCPPYIFQQQQQVQIVSAATNIQPYLPRSQNDVFPSQSPAICAATDSDLQDPLRLTPASTPIKSAIISNSLHSNITREISINHSSTIDLDEDKSSIAEEIEETSISEDLDESETSIPAGIEDESDRGNNDTNICSDIILEKNDDDEIVTVHINVEHKQQKTKTKRVVNNELIEETEKEENDLNKACQTVTERDLGKIVFDENQAVQISSNNNYESVPVDIECASGSGLQNNGTVTVLEMEDMNFILQSDFMQNGQMISKVNNIDCIDANNDNRSPDLMNIGEEAITSTNMLEDNQDYEDKFIDEEKLDNESVSEESLNIRADEKMPPRGELSEQESNGASEIGWGSRIYQEGSSGMSTSYDLLARESWEGSDCSDIEMPPLQSRPPISYNTEDVDEPDPQPEPESQAEDDDEDDVDDDKSKPPLTFNFKCSICGETFRCPKERRVHQTKDHGASSSSAAKKSSKTNINCTSSQSEIEDDKLDVLVKDEDFKEEIMEIKDEAGPKETFLCNTCGELLSSMRELQLHNKRVHNILLPSQSLTCKTCNEAFTKQKDFIEHLKQHPLECNICGKQFYKPTNLKLHLKRHAGVRPFKCELCTKAFFAKQKLREHMNIHTGNSPIKCTMCDESFKRYSNLVQHRNHHHLKIKKKTRDYICHCGEVYQTKNKLNWHKEIHESKPKSCIYCNEKFIHMASLTRHIRRAHNQRYVPDDSRQNENVECKICKGVYLKSSLEAHLYTHSDKKQHTCTICNKEFTTKWNLKLHKWIHAAPTTKPFKCDICNCAYFRESDYISHMNSHRSIKPYICNYCGCKFIRKYNCIRHVREHEEGKTYNCDVCNKSFHRSYYLKEHMRVHTGVKPFSCNICGKTSTTKSNHNKHMKIHHAREPVPTEG